MSIAHVMLSLPFELFIHAELVRAAPGTAEGRRWSTAAACGILRPLRHGVLLPDVVPVVVMTALLTFLAGWNEFFAVRQHRPGHARGPGWP